MNHRIKVKNPSNINSEKLGETVQNTENTVNFVSFKPSISTGGINSDGKGNTQGAADLRMHNEKAQNNTSNVKSVVEDLDVLLGLDKNEQLDSINDEILVGAKLIILHEFKK